MNQTNRDRDVIRRYLLGDAAEGELAVLEERILTDDDFYQELLIAEDDLIDQYLSETLSESERSKFVSHFLITPDRQEKFSFSKTLKSYVTVREHEVSNDFSELVSARGDSTRPPELVSARDDSSRPPELVPPGRDSSRQRWFESYFPITGRPSFDAIFGNRLALTAFSLIILAAVSIVLINRISEQKSVAPEDLFIATLTPGLTRGRGETTRITIPPNKKVVRLELQLESLPTSQSDSLASRSESLANNNQSGSAGTNTQTVGTMYYRSYTAELRTAENTTVLRRDNLQPEMKGNRQVVNLDVPAENLRGGEQGGGDYHVRLSGLGAGGASEPIGRYSFRIVN